MNHSSVWRALDEGERPEALAVDAPGLVFVWCERCAASEPVDDVLLLVRSTLIAPLVVVLPWEQLQDPRPVLEGLQEEVGDRVPGMPVLAPRVLLPLLLLRDVERDASDPEGATAEVTADHGEDMGSLYRSFLLLAADQDAVQAPARALETLWGLPDDQLAGWLHDNSDAVGPGLLALLDQMTDRADAAGDEGSAGQLRLMRGLFEAIAGGTPPADAVACYQSAMTKHFDAHLRPELDRLWEASQDTNSEVAIPALRGLLKRIPEPDESGRRRRASGLLATHLLASRPHMSAIDEAIGMLEEVRASSPRRDSEWAAATGNLAVAVGDLGTGDLVDNWRRSVALLREALTAPHADPRTIAVNETNLGLALTNRPRGATSEELNEALGWLRRGLDRRSPEASAEDWAYSKINIGLAHRRRSGPGDIDQAIHHLSEAVNRLRGTSLTRLLVYAELNLSVALLAADPPALTRGLAVATSAADRAQQLHDPFLEGWTFGVRGDAQAAHDGPGSTDAIASWQNSVDVLEPAVHPVLLLNNAYSLVASYEAAGKWALAAAVYERMLVAFDALYTNQATGEARRHVLGSHSRLARWAAYALARIGRFADAIEALERGRTRELVVNFRRDTADLERLGRHDPGLVIRYRDALSRYRVVATGLQATEFVSRASTADEAVTAAIALNRVIDQVRAIPSFEGFLRAPTAVESLLQAGTRQALYVVSAPAGTFVLRIAAERPGAPPSYSAVHIDVTSRDIAEMLLVDFETGDPGLLAAQLNEADPNALDATLARLNPRLAQLLAALAEFAVEAAPHCSVLVPTGLAGLFPLQSMPIRVDGTTLDDAAEVHLAPSLAVYAASRRRASRKVSPHFVGIADTDPDQPLPGSRGEVNVIAARPGWSSVSIAVGADANWSWLAEHAPSASHLHLACHGRNNLEDPDGSHLVLGGGDLLTVPALIHDIRLRARIAVASACQSGQFAAGMVPDEQVGLATGLLQAGAACVVVSLWPVSDEATALLMTRLYDLLDTDGDGQPYTQAPQSALRQARLWLRDLTEAGRDAYLNQHPALANVLRSRGLPAAATSRGARGPYDTVQDWGAFVAYGC